MQRSKRIGKPEITLGGTKVLLEIIKELAAAIPADCVGPVVGATLKIIEMVEVRM